MLVYPVHTCISCSSISHISPFVLVPHVHPSLMFFHLSCPSISHVLLSTVAIALLRRNQDLARLRHSLFQFSTATWARFPSSASLVLRMAKSRPTLHLLCSSSLCRLASWLARSSARFVVCRTARSCAHAFSTEALLSLHSWSRSARDATSSSARLAV